MSDDKKGRKEKKIRKAEPVSFSKLTRQALPEMWIAQLISKGALFIMILIFSRLVRVIIFTRASAVTTSNLWSVLFGWQGVALLLTCVLFVLVYISLELFSQMVLCEEILEGKKAGILNCVKRGFQTIPRLLSPGGFSILAYIFIAVPLVGIGFSVRITKQFHIPNFIMSVIEGRNVYFLLYIVLLIGLALFGLFYIFSAHAIVLKGMKAREAKKYSVRLMKKNWKRFLRSMFIVLLVCGALRVVWGLAVDLIPVYSVNSAFADIPKDYHTMALEDLLNAEELSEFDSRVIGYRIMSAFIILEATYLDALIRLLTSAFVMLYFTRLFLLYDREETEEPPCTEIFFKRPKKGVYFLYITAMLGIAIFLFITAVLFGICYEDLVDKSPVPIIAHRCGGDLASENSIEGLYAAIDHGCYGSETDVQRTKDGYYVINHDDNFKRLTGVNKAPQDMTLAEIKELRIQDTTGSGQLLEVPTLDEFLDVPKGKEILFIELKGKTADRQMVDDVVRIVREHDCVDGVVLISLKYDVIDYAETTYPEFETGLLFFAGVGDFTGLNCDILITEEEMTSNALIATLHLADKKSMVWTVNTEEDLYEFLDMELDGVITDTVELAEKVQEELDDRTDVEIIRDSLGNIWN